MLNGDAATYRVHDMVRTAEGHRASRSIAKRRSAERGAWVRRLAASTIALLSMPFRHERARGAVASGACAST